MTETKTRRRRKVAPAKIDMRALILSESKTAHAFACDGAYFTAADILDKLAKDIRSHAEAKKSDMDALVAGDFNDPLARARREIADRHAHEPEYAAEILSGALDNRAGVKLLARKYEADQ